MNITNSSIFPPVDLDFSIEKSIQSIQSEKKEMTNESQGDWNKEDYQKLCETAIFRIKKIVSKCTFNAQASIQETQFAVKFPLKKGNETETYSAILLPAAKNTSPIHKFDLILFNEKCKISCNSKKVITIFDAFRLIEQKKGDYLFTDIDKKIKEEVKNRFVLLSYLDKSDRSTVSLKKEFDLGQKIISVHTVKSHAAFIDTFFHHKILVQEHCGTNLFSYLKHTEISKSQAMELAGQILCGLKDMSKQSVAFYDCKLPNVAFNKIVKFIDADGWLERNNEQLVLHDGFTPDYVDILAVLLQISQLAKTDNKTVKYSLPLGQIKKAAAHEEEIKKASQYLSFKVDFEKITIETLNIWAAGLLITQILAKVDEMKALFVQSLENEHVLPWSECLKNINFKVREMRGIKIESTDPRFSDRTLLSYLEELFTILEKPLFKTNNDPFLSVLSRSFSVSLEVRPKLEELSKHLPCSADHVFSPLTNCNTVPDTSLLGPTTGTQEVNQESFSQTQEKVQNSFGSWSQTQDKDASPIQHVKKSRIENE